MSTIKAFSTRSVFGKQIAIMPASGRIFKANSVSFNSEDLDFGRELKNQYTYTVAEYATVIGFNPSADLKTIEITALATRKDGTPITDDEQSLLKFTINSNDSMDINTWSDNEDSVLSLCERENDETIHGLLAVIEKANEKIEYVKRLTSLNNSDSRPRAKKYNEVVDIESNITAKKSSFYDESAVKEDTDVKKAPMFKDDFDTAEEERL